MPRNASNRKNPLRREWEIALAHAGRKPHEVARSWGIGKSTINGVLAGRITSGPTHARIEAFIRRHVPAAQEAA